MKRIIVFFSILFYSILLQAQSFQIFRTTPNVQVYQNQQWIPAQKRMVLALSDSINIPNNQFISILNTNNNQIIEVKTPGKHCLKKVLDATLRESANILSYTTQNIANAVSSNGKSQNYNVYGATMRSEFNTIENNHSLTFKLLPIIAGIQEGKLPKQSKLLALHTTEIDSTKHFSIVNHDKIPYVVNILRIPRTGNVSFCLNVDKTDSEYFFVLVGPESTLDLSHIALGLDDATYLLVATPDIFDASWLEIGLQYPPQTKTKKRVKLEVSLSQ